MQPRIGRSKWPAREAARVLVGAGREEEVARERARLGAVDLRLVVELEVVPARFAVHAEADVADGVALTVAERREVGAEEIGVEPSPSIATMWSSSMRSVTGSRM